MIQAFLLISKRPDDHFADLISLAYQCFLET